MVKLVVEGNFSATVLAMACNTLSRRLLYLRWSKATLKLFRVWTRVYRSSQRGQESFLSLSLQMKRAPIVTDNTKLLEICITSVKEKLQDSSCLIVNPTDTFRKRTINSRPISAANLLMYDTSVVNGKPLAEHHFHKVPLTSVIGANELSDFIGMIDHFLQKLSQRQFVSYLRPAIVQCEAEVFKQLGWLGDRGITTAESQTSAITDPILSLLRSFCCLEVCIIIFC